jgi:hypothetical protein
VRRFQSRVRKGKFAASYVVRADEETQKHLSRRFPGLQDRAY